MGEALRAVWETMFKGCEAAVNCFQKEAKPRIKKYFKCLLLLFALSFIPSLPLIYYGIFHDSSWALVIGGAWRACCILLLLIAATPIGIVFEIATGGVAGSGQRYVKLISGVFIAELLFVLIVSIIPVSNNPKMFPIFILASVLCGFLGALRMNRKVISMVVGTTLVCIVLSFYLPNTFGEVKTFINRIDIQVSKPARLQYKLNDYKTGNVDFFYPDGEPKVWYAVVDNKIELFNKKGIHSFGFQLEKVDTYVLEKLRSANWENLSPSNIIPEQNVEEKAQAPQQVPENNNSNAIQEKPLQENAQPTQQEAQKQQAAEAEQKRAEVEQETQRQQAAERERERLVEEQNKVALDRQQHDQYAREQQTTQVSLTITNLNCYSSDYYMNNQLVATVQPNSYAQLTVRAETYTARACLSGTSSCGPDTIYTISGGTFNVTINRSRACESANGYGYGYAFRYANNRLAQPVMRVIPVWQVRHAPRWRR
jgi:hypothetical protein